MIHTFDRDKSVKELTNSEINFKQTNFSYSGKQYYHETKVNEKNRVNNLWLDSTATVFQNKQERVTKEDDLYKKIDYHKRELDNKIEITRKKRKKILLN